jgi:hypothetical protein
VARRSTARHGAAQAFVAGTRDSPKTGLGPATHRQRCTTSCQRGRRRSGCGARVHKSHKQK